MYLNVHTLVKLRKKDQLESILTKLEIEDQDFHSRTLCITSQGITKLQIISV